MHYRWHNGMLAWSLSIQSTYSGTQTGKVSGDFCRAVSRGTCCGPNEDKMVTVEERGDRVMLIYSDSTVGSCEETSCAANSVCHPEIFQNISWRAVWRGSFILGCRHGVGLEPLSTGAVFQQRTSCQQLHRPKQLITWTPHLARSLWV